MDLLSGVRVVSFNHFLLGPLAMQALADMGADVIAVESIEGAFQRHWAGGDVWVDGQSAFHLCANRGKRSVALNLKDPQGRAIALDLAAGADVVGENFRPGVIEKLGLGYDAVRARNPKVIYASATGYGRDGPCAEEPGQDLLIQAVSGLAAVTGNREDRARPVGVSAVDHHGAALLAMGILAALLRRERTGEGGRVDVDLLSAALHLQTESLTAYTNGSGTEDERAPRWIAGWHYPAPYGVYPTADGHIAISLCDLGALADALGRPEVTRVAGNGGFDGRDELAALVADAVAAEPTAHWLEALTAKGIWHAPVNGYAEVIDHPQVRHNGSLATVEGATGAPVTLVRHPVAYDGARPDTGLPPQPLGAQTAEVLRELGHDDAAIAALAEAGAIGLPDAIPS